MGRPLWIWSGLAVILLVVASSSAAPATQQNGQEDVPSDGDMTKMLEDDWANPLVDEKEQVRAVGVKKSVEGAAASVGTIPSVNKAAGFSAAETFKQDYADLMGPVKSSQPANSPGAGESSPPSAEFEEAVGDEGNDDEEGDSDMTELTGHFNYLMKGLSKKNMDNPSDPSVEHHHSVHHILNDAMQGLGVHKFKLDLPHESVTARVKRLLNPRRAVVTSSEVNDSPEMEENDQEIDAEKVTEQVDDLESKLKDQDEQLSKMESVEVGDGNADDGSMIESGGEDAPKGEGKEGMSADDNVEDDSDDNDAVRSSGEPDTSDDDSALEADLAEVPSKAGRRRMTAKNGSKSHRMRRGGKAASPAIVSQLSGATSSMTESVAYAKKKKRSHGGYMKRNHPPNLKAMGPPKGTIGLPMELKNVGPSKVVDGGTWVESGQVWPNIGNRLWGLGKTAVGRREVKIPVRFKNRFLRIPAVHLGLVAWDFPNGADPVKERTLNVFAKHVTEAGFTLVIQTWGRTQMRSAGVSWMAFGINNGALQRMKVHRYLMDKMKAVAFRRQKQFNNQKQRKTDFEAWTKDQHKFAQEKFKWLRQVIRQHKYVENMLRVVRLVKARVDTLGAHYDRTNHVNNRLQKIIPRLNSWAWGELKIMKMEVHEYLKLVKSDMPKQDAGLRWWDHERFREISYEMKEMWFKRRLLNTKAKNLRFLMETVGAKGHKQPDLSGPKKGVFCHCKHDPTEMIEPSVSTKAAASLLAHHVNADAANPNNMDIYPEPKEQATEELLQTGEKATYNAKVCVCQGQGGVSIDGFQFPKKFML